MTFPMTPAQRDLIETIRRQQNISSDVLDQLCQRHWECGIDDLSLRAASALIDSLKDKTGIQRELQLIAGQQSLFGEVAS